MVDTYIWIQKIIKRMIKKYSKCGVEKDLSLFNKDISSKDEHRSNCKECCKQYRRIYRSLNIEKIREKSRGRKVDKEKKKILNDKYYLKNKEKIKQKSRNYYIKNREKKLEYQKKYQKENKDKRNLYLSERRKNDPLFNLITNIRNLIYNSFYYNGYVKSSKTQDLLGCSFSELKEYLENKFEDWMSWNNKGLYNGEFNYGWDIDHIIPLSSAENEEDVIKLCHHTNLQPMCSKINRDIKKNNIEYNGII